MELKSYGRHSSAQLASRPQLEHPFSAQAEAGRDGKGDARIWGREPFPLRLRHQKETSKATPEPGSPQQCAWASSRCQDLPSIFILCCSCLAHSSPPAFIFKHNKPLGSYLWLDSCLEDIVGARAGNLPAVGSLIGTRTTQDVVRGPR